MPAGMERGLGAPLWPSASSALCTRGAAGASIRAPLLGMSEASLEMMCRGGGASRTPIGQVGLFEAAACDSSCRVPFGVTDSWLGLPLCRSAVSRVDLALAATGGDGDWCVASNAESLTPFDTAAWCSSYSLCYVTVCVTARSEATARRLGHATVRCTQFAEHPVCECLSAGVKTKPLTATSPHPIAYLRPRRFRRRCSPRDGRAAEGS